MQRREAKGNIYIRVLCRNLIIHLEISSSTAVTFSCQSTFSFFPCLSYFSAIVLFVSVLVIILLNNIGKYVYNQITLIQMFFLT